MAGARRCGARVSSGGPDGVAAALAVASSGVPRCGAPIAAAPTAAPGRAPTVAAAGAPPSGGCSDRPPVWRAAGEAATGRGGGDQQGREGRRA